ncbi:MAG TPA: DUF4389 domain-containing protein [Gaiella sp.]|nr:DUF4389 domain-containing protein [Gaiella sp.]
MSSPHAAQRPVRLVVTDDLARRRSTVLFRLVLALPHLVWVTLYGIAALTLVFVVWLAVLFERRAPRTPHTFLASYVRYTVHLTAYLTLAASPYPSFTGSTEYPVDVEIDAPARQGRLAAGFRLLLALPALLLSSTLGGSAALGGWSGVALLSGTGGLAVAVAVLGWVASLVRGRMPRGMRDAATYAIGYGAETAAYALLLTDRYPLATPGRVEPEPELPLHPVAIGVRDDLGRPRLLVAFRFLLVIPHLLWLTLWAAAALLAAIVAWVVALVLGRVPRFLHRFLAAFVRATTHVWAFLYVVGRPFPGFVGREGSYPIDLTIAPPARQRRLGVLARLVLVLPAFVLSSAYSGVLLVVGVMGWIAALATGRMPVGLRDLGAAALRYQAQVFAYLFLLTSRYPDSSPVLRGRSPEPPPLSPLPAEVVP